MLLGCPELSMKLLARNFTELGKVTYVSFEQFFTAEDSKPRQPYSTTTYHIVDMALTASEETMVGYQFAPDFT